MALTPKDSDAFLREVDDELRRDQIRGFFSRFGALLIAAVVLFLGAVGGYLWWQHHQISTAEKQGEEFSAVLTDVATGKAKGRDARVDRLAGEGNAAYRTQAELLKAGFAAEQGKDAEAIAAYRRIVADDDLPQAYRDAALVRQTALEYDKLQPAAVIQRLKPLAVKGNPWFGTAGEMVGIAYMRQGKTQLAAPLFEALVKDETVPTSIRQRASEVALSMGVGLEDNGGSAVAAKEATR